MRNYFLIETAFTHRKFVFPPLEKNGQAHVAIATKTVYEPNIFVSLSSGFNARVK